MEQQTKDVQSPTESQAKHHQSTYFGFVCQLSNRHHKQCIKYNDVYIDKLEKHVWNYISRKVTNIENLIFTTARKSKFTSSSATS